MSVPKVRNAVHKATAPREYALPKTRERGPAGQPLSVAAAPCPSIASPLVDHGFMESLDDPYDPAIRNPIGARTGPVAFRPEERGSTSSGGGSSGGGSSGGGSSSGGDPGSSSTSSSTSSGGDPSSSTGGIASSTGGIPSSSGGGGAVPEPHAWLQMLLGFALIGGSLRLARRKPTPDEEEVLARADKLK